MPNKNGSNTHSDSRGLFSEFSAVSPEEWRAEAERALKGADFEKKLLSPTPEGITLRPIYNREDLADLIETSSPPGFAPFLRGNRAWRNEASAWQVTQQLDYPDHEDFNKALLEDLAHGLSAVVLPLDVASRYGNDPDTARPEDIGADGVSIATTRELERALQGVDLASVPVIIDSCAVGLPTLGMLVAVTESKGAGLDQIFGALAMDPLTDATRENARPIPVDGLLNDTAAVTLWAEHQAPNLGTVWVHGNVFHDAGASAVQELAFSIAAGVYYLRELEERGCEPAVTARHLRFGYALGPRFFMEVAKLRAARLLWNRVCEACDINEPDRAMHIHARTSRYAMTSFDPYINMLRATTETLAGSVGSVDSLQVSPFDEHVRAADEFSRRIARNTQLIVRDEVRAGAVLDPAGGSWFVERLTSDLAEKAWGLFQETERRGGMWQCLVDGFPQESIAKTADKRTTALRTRKQVIVGTNQFPNPSDKPLQPRAFDYKAFRVRRSDEYGKLRASDTRQEAKAALARLAELKASQPAALVDAVINCARCGATLGELTSALATRRTGSDEATHVAPFKRHRASEEFEQLRYAVEEFRSDGGNARVFMATLGSIARYMPRYDFAASFFEIGGFEVERTQGYADVKKTIEAAVQSKAPIVIICGLDDSYKQTSATLAETIRAKNPESLVVLAGLPETELKTELESAGIDYFIHAQCDALQLLREMAGRIGVVL